MIHGTAKIICQLHVQLARFNSICCRCSSCHTREKCATCTRISPHYRAVCTFSCITCAHVSDFTSRHSTVVSTVCVHGQPSLASKAPCNLSSAAGRCCGCGGCRGSCRGPVHTARWLCRNIGTHPFCANTDIPCNTGACVAAVKPCSAFGRALP